MWSKNKTGYIFLIIIISFFLCLSSCTKETNTFRFVFMTDIHVQPEKKADEGFRAAIEKVNALNVIGPRGKRMEFSLVKR